MTRRPPTLLIEFELERGHGRVWLLAAETFEDEMRLRQWLRRSSALATLGEDVQRLLDELDRINEGAA
jgi:hypothetical protein